MSVILTSANFIFPLITYSYVARILTPAGTGKIAFVDSILSYFAYLAMLGIPTYGVREVAKLRDNKEEMSKLVKELFILNLFSTCISYIFLFFSVIFIPRLYEERFLFIIMGISIFLNTIGLEWVYQALEEYSYITIRSIVFKIISVILIFLMVKSGNDIKIYGFLHIFTNSASYILNFIHIRKYLTVTKKNVYDLSRHIKPVITLFAASVIITIYANFDVSMLGFMSIEQEIGLYNAATKIKMIVRSLSTAITNVLVPRMAYYLQNKNEDMAGKLIVKSLRVSFIIAIPVAVYIFVFAEYCIVFLCGEEYLMSVSTLRVLMICIIPLVLTNLFGVQILIPSGNEKHYTQSVFIGLWINLILNFWLIPIHGSFGAAIATLVTEIWNVIWMGIGVKPFIKKLLTEINFFIYIIPMLASVLCSYSIITRFDLSTFIILAISSTVYFALYYMLLYLLKEPIVRKQSFQIINNIKSKVKQQNN